MLADHVMDLVRQTLDGRKQAVLWEKPTSTAVFGQLGKFGTEQDKRFAVTYPRANGLKERESPVATIDVTMPRCRVRCSMVVAVR